MSSITKKIKIITEKDVVTGIKCNTCNKEIDDGCGYWSVTNHHDDWGRDSIDSFSYADYCSKECLATAFLKYMDDSETELGGMNSMQMDIERKYFKRKTYDYITEGGKNDG